MTADEELYAQIKAAQTLAAENLQRRWGASADQVAQAQRSLAAPAPTDPNTVTAANIEAAWKHSADSQFRSLHPDAIDPHAAVGGLVEAFEEVLDLRLHLLIPHGLGRLWATAPATASTRGHRG